MSKASFKRMMRERSRVRPVAQPDEQRQRYTPPTDEQLANFVAATVSAAAAADGLPARLDPLTAGLMLLADPIAKRLWLRRHREFQEATDAVAAERGR